MKKLTYLIAVLLSSTFMTRNANAFWPDLTPLIPIAPQFCPMCTPPAVMTALGYVKQVKAIKDDLTKFTDMTQLKQMATSYLPSLGATSLNSWRQKDAAKKKVISFSRTIEECSVADITKEESVKEAFIKLFLQYPSKKNKIKAAYEEMGEQLKMDTTLEMFITAKEMEKELLGKEPGKEIEPTAQNLADLGILKQIDLIESCLVEGKNCDVIGLDACVESKKGSNSEEGPENDEDNVCYWNSALQAEKFYDAVMRYNEFLVSMHAQYQAVMGIERLAKIREYKQKVSSLEYLPHNQNFASSLITANAVFADMAAAEREAEEDLSDYNAMLSTSDNTLGGEFEENSKAGGFESALDGKDDDFASIEILDEAQEDANKALHIHNLKQLMPDYRRTYKDYHNAKIQHDLAVENLTVSGECISQMLNPYYENSSEAWHGNDCQYYERGKLACHYKPEQDFDENNEVGNEGEFNTACPGDEGHKCYIISLEEAQTEAKGISGYLTTLYATAKDMDATADADSFINAETEEGSSDAFVARTTVNGEISQSSDGSEDIYVTAKDRDSENNNAGRKNLLDKATARTDDSEDDSALNLTDQRKGDEEKENARKDGIIRWVLGAEVAKEVALDLDSGVHEFGTRTKKFPLWTDQKVFYDQYIDGKYENIAEYIETAPTAEIVLNIAGKLNEIYPYEDIVKGMQTITADEQREKNGKTIQNTQKSLTSTVENSEESLIAERLSAEDARFASIENAYKAAIAALVAERERIYDKMDAANKIISEKNEKYDENNEIIKAADATSGEAEEAVEYGDELYKDRELSADSPQNTAGADDPDGATVIGFKTKDAKNEADKSVAITEKAEADNTKDLEAEVRAYKARLEEIKNEIEEKRIEHVRNMSNAEMETRVQFAELSQSLKDARTISNAVSLPNVAPVTLAKGFVECVRDYAKEQVQLAKTKLDEMKVTEELYRTEFADKVYEIHADMIEKITKISPEDLATCEVLSELQSMEGADDEMLTDALNILASVCEDGKCLQRDNNYFVGALGLPRDFMAPNPALEFSSAPLREIFHFDVFDFNNLDKHFSGNIKDVESNMDIYTSASNFLEFLRDGATNSKYGSSIPLIWERILSRHAFVQKDMDLVALLSGNDDIVNSTRKALSRSGVFPCKIDAHVVDVSLNLDYMVDKTKDADKYYELPTCKGLTLKKGVVFDEEVGGGNINMNPPGFTGNVVRASELGNILSYVPDKDTLLALKLHGTELTEEVMAKLPHRLTFNANLIRAVKKIVETEAVGEEGEEDEDSLFYLANRVMLERNQFGDYLDQVENESIKADELAKLEKQINEIRSGLMEIFIDTGFELGEDFDLANDSDYNQASSVLDEQKNTYVKQSTSKLGQVQGTTQTIADKVSKIKHQLDILNLDSDEVVSITGTETEADLQQKIENRKADLSVGDEFTKAKEEEAARKLERYRRPYCAVYPQ